MMKLTRRDFCRTTLAGLSSVALTSQCQQLQAKDEEPQIPIVDCHTHFFDPTRKEGVPWPSKDDKLLYRSVLPKEFAELSKPFGVVGTVVVEASSWLEDNQWLLDLAAKDPFVLGVVGNLTPGTDTFALELARFARNPMYRGFRVNADLLNQGLDRPEYVRDLRRLIDADLELDVNGGPEMLAVVNRLADKLPELRIVINHLSNVKNDSKKPPADWIAGVNAAAKHPHVFMKVSALVENSRRKGKAPGDTAYYRPILQETWNAFGADRLIYGSNWPVSDYAGPYSLIVQIVKDFWKDLGTTAARKFFYENSQAAYKWPKR